MSEDQIRHCGYCLKEIKGAEVKKCAGCLRRCYCSRDCQVADWGSKGQTHKLWCKENICEEDLDWEIRDSPGKGLGVFAKRMIPKHTKIMVDKGYRGVQETPSDFLNTLMPHPGSLQEKWDLNSFYTPEGGDNIGIRLARVNFDCRNNATNKFVPDLSTFILIAIRDIQQDEEISIQYYFYNDFSTSKEIRDARETIIKEKWEVNCDSTCICKNSEIKDKIQKAHELDELIPTLPLKTENDVKKSLKHVDDLIKMNQELSSGIMPLSRAYYDGFQIAITHKKTFPLHKKYIEKYLEAMEIVNSKHSQAYSEALQYLKYPNSHRNHY
ncbi:hypothetical protein DICPUDRAFT_74166 [Dictyostelium purpureum]|uniref:MYND-type domain-containing protein n=1 Tax=Dictyostelium purpureum TaxID=5786 RepID=F0Z6Z2_DICPU|nr:uncharacterized protein DICPUDRAFT_74166 [Dictyostelium purpureum]EGC40239.1 hypothetical protein DICPUDRAFT_74166 [Dictyostelium purpureum]|eukprot:XP_003283175.1 hypothetical protein DICPUDRAFT_74166 [Dictyostelium purpureum]